MKRKVLIVEDEAGIRDLLSLNLGLEGFETAAAACGKDAFKLLEFEHFDLCLLDVMLPDISGMDIAARLRLEHPSLPVIFLTARDNPPDRVKGLRLGAADYLGKPFHMEELLLRMENVLKRHPGEPASGGKGIFRFGENRIDFDAHLAFTASGEIRLSKREVQFLKLLIDRKNEVVERKEILHLVWGYDVFPTTRTVDNFINSFRKYFEADRKHPRHFLSFRGKGYMFSAGD